MITPLCDLFEDDVGQLVKRCPALRVERDRLFNEIRSVEDSPGRTFPDNQLKSSCKLLGSFRQEYLNLNMEAIWMVATEKNKLDVSQTHHTKRVCRRS